MLPITWLRLLNVVTDNWESSGGKVWVLCTVDSSAGQLLNCDTVNIEEETSEMANDNTIGIGLYLWLRIRNKLSTNQTILEVLLGSPVVKTVRTPRANPVLAWSFPSLILGPQERRISTQLCMGTRKAFMCTSLRQGVRVHLDPRRTYRFCEQFGQAETEGPNRPFPSL